MNVLLLLASVLLILMVAVGGMNGVRSFISLFLNGIIFTRDGIFYVGYTNKYFTINTCGLCGIMWS